LQNGDQEQRAGRTLKPEVGLEKPEDLLIWISASGWWMRCITSGATQAVPAEYLADRLVLGFEENPVYGAFEVG